MCREWNLGEAWCLFKSDKTLVYICQRLVYCIEGHGVHDDPWSYCLCFETDGEAATIGGNPTSCRKIDEISPLPGPDHAAAMRRRVNLLLSGAPDHALRRPLYSTEMFAVSVDSNLPRLFWTDDGIEHVHQKAIDILCMGDART
jgi:hypothetical protein